MGYSPRGLKEWYTTERLTLSHNIAFSNLRLQQGLPSWSSVKTLTSNAGGVGLIPGWAAKIASASRPKNQNIKNRNHIVTNSIKDLKNSPLQNNLKKKKTATNVQSTFPTIQLHLKTVFLKPS